VILNTHILPMAGAPLFVFYFYRQPHRWAKTGKDPPPPLSPPMGAVNIAPMERDPANKDRVSLSETLCNFVFLMLHRHMACTTWMRTWKRVGKGGKRREGIVWREGIVLLSR